MTTTVNVQAGQDRRVRVSTVTETPIDDTHAQADAVDVFLEPGETGSYTVSDPKVHIEVVEVDPEDEDA